MRITTSFSSRPCSQSNRAATTYMPITIASSRPRSMKSMPVHAITPSKMTSTASPRIIGAHTARPVETIPKASTIAGQAGGEGAGGGDGRQTGVVGAEGAERAAQAGPEGLGLAGGGCAPFAADGVLHLEDLVLGELRGRGSPLFAHTGSATVIWESTISR